MTTNNDTSIIDNDEIIKPVINISNELLSNQL